MRKLKPLARFLLLFGLLVSTGVLAQSETIDRIEVQGLFRMTPESFRIGLGVSEGDPYDPQLLRTRFKALWRLGLFEDITMESEVGAGGTRVLVIKVKERPVLTSVTYQDSNDVTRTEIDDRLRERKVRLKLGKAIDMEAIFFAESAIRDLLAEKGFLNAEVSAEVRPVTETSRAVHFFLGSGGKTRILEIDFTGNELFADRKLRSVLQLTEERKWFWPWSAKNLYHPAKWDQDVSAVRDLYQNLGYLDVEIRPPVVEVRKQGKPKAEEPPPPIPEVPDLGGEIVSPDEELTLKQQQKRLKKQIKEEEQARKKADKRDRVKRWVHLTVPVLEGQQYTLGEISFSGNDAYPENVLRALIPLKQGGILQQNRLDFGIDRVTRLYEDLGHLYASVVRRVERREGETVADVTVTVDEDKPYYVARIDFTGNSSTHDKVIRREMLLNEGELFSRSKLDISRAKINQLGYWQAPGEAVIEPIEDTDRIKITLAGEETSRNEIQVGGGFSGIDGAFFNGVYSTRNFLGRGQVLSTAIQVGGRSSRYQISFQEPWLFNRPYRFGFSVFRRDLDFGSSLRSTSDGAGILFGKRLGRFSNLSLGYNWESVTSTTGLTSIDNVGTRTITAENVVSSVTPVYSYNTINNPYRPTSGKSISLSFQVAGGPLGGNTSFIKPIASFTGYWRATKKSYLAFHTQGGLVRKFSGGSDQVGAADVEGVPRFQRFWLGGDTLGPRVFETRSITPLRYVQLDSSNRIMDVLGDPRFNSPDEFVNSQGIPALVEVGGDRFFLIQSEWVLPFNEQAELALFVDAGDALFEDQSFGFDTTRVSAGVELRFHLPIFPVPLRLIYGVPVRELQGDDTGNFTFSIGRSF